MLLQIEYGRDDGMYVLKGHDYVTRDCNAYFVRRDSPSLALKEQAECHELPHGEDQLAGSLG